MDPQTFHNVLFGHWYEDPTIKNLKTSESYLLQEKLAGDFDLTVLVI